MFLVRLIHLNGFPFPQAFYLILRDLTSSFFVEFNLQISPEGKQQQQQA